MSDDTSIFEGCVDTHSSNLSVELLQCVSDATEAARSSLTSGVDTFYLIYAGALVFFMQVGFAMLCAGSIREKNVKNVLLWNLLDSAGGAIGFWSIGYAFAYGGEDINKGKTFIGNAGFFLTGDTDMEFWFFQFAFACALSSIVAGTIAERCKMTAYLCYSIFLCGFVYPVAAHSFWSVNGFLSPFAKEPLWGSGAIDLAGSGPVHMTGGVAALVMAIVLGPRKGRFYDEDGVPLEEPKAMGPHSVTLQFLGTFGLWFGWYGFNPGSTLKISTAELGDVASLVAVNTTLGAAAGALSGMFTSTILDERKTGVYQWDTTAAMNGCLTGLVGITAGCATVEPWAAFIIGLVSGWVYLAASALILRFKIDDAVDAIPVHMFGGAWGVISTGLFTNANRLAVAGGSTDNIGWFYEWGRGSGNFTLIGIQLLAVLFVFGWTAGIFTPFCLVLKFLNWLRIDPLEEEVGMDISRHKGPAYESQGSSAEAIRELSASRRNLMDSSNSGRGFKGKSFKREKPVENNSNGAKPADEPKPEDKSADAVESVA
jgi:Amt family ammonium transporter